MLYGLEIQSIDIKGSIANLLYVLMAHNMSVHALCIYFLPFDRG